MYNCKFYGTAFCKAPGDGEERSGHSPARTDWDFRRGDIYLADTEGSGRAGSRPVVVLQGNQGNYNCPSLVIAPLIRPASGHRMEPVHYYASRVQGLRGPALVLLDQVDTVNKSRIRRYLGRLSCRQMDQMREQLESCLDLYIQEDTEAP